MSQQDDRPDDAPTEWLSPALYRQLCDAVDSALFAPPDARDGILAARLGGDQRLLAEARALLASHEQSPHTMVTPAGGDETYIAPRHDSATYITPIVDSATMLRRDSATVIVPGSGSHRAWSPESDGTAVVPAMPDPEPPVGSAATTPGIPINLPPPEPLRITNARPAWGPATPAGPPPLAEVLPVARPDAPPLPVAPPEPSEPPPLAVAPPVPLPSPRPVAPPVIAAPPAAAAAPPAPAPSPAPAPVRSADIGAPIPTRKSGKSGSSAGTLVGYAVAVLALVGAGVAVWLMQNAKVAQQDAELRRAQAETRFKEVRQLGQRLPEVDRLLAVTPDPGAQAARAVLLRTWMQYLTDLQRASGSTDRELLLEVAKGYRQLAGAQGGLSGRTVGDRAGAVKTLQIGVNLLAYLDRTSTQPEPAVIEELAATLVDLGDVQAGGKDAAAANDQYRRALTVAEKLAGANVDAAAVKQRTDLIRQRIQSGPPAPPAAAGAPAPPSEES